MRTAFRDRRRSSRRRAHSIAASLRRRSEESKGAAKAITGQLAGIAAKAANEAEDVVRNARRALSHKQMTSSGRLRRVLDELAVTVERTRRVVAQTRIRLSGQTPDGATRLVSLHDPHARPLRKGRLDRPTEFGYTAQVVDNADGVIVDYEVSSGNPPDAPRLAPAVARIKARTGKAPDTVAADRGYGEARVEEELGALGVKKTVTPRKGKPPSARRAHEHRPAFRRAVKWRTGAEGRISCLKRDFGWRRTRLDGIDGARTWCGHGVFTHNLVKIGALVSE